MFEPIIEAFKWIASLIPGKDFQWKRPKLNFIAVHYLYILGMTIVGSIMLFPAGGMPYIDALFFAAGMATQSGLNTIDINTLSLYQQIVMMALTCFCTPIFIHTVVVFVRLYWFEKRFEHIVKEIRGQRASRARSLRSGRTISRNKEEREQTDPSMLEKGVNGRSITVLHETTVPNGMSGTSAQSSKDKIGVETTAESTETTPPASGAGSFQEGQGSSESSLPKVASNDVDAHQEVFETPMSTGHSSFHDHNPLDDALAPDEKPKPARLPNNDPSDMTRHITFLEQQQNNAKKSGALRIPGPRDFDRGQRPEELNEEEVKLRRPITNYSIAGRSEQTDQNDEGEGSPRGDHYPRKGISFNEPQRPDHRDRASEEVSTADETIISRLDRMRNGILNRKHSGRSLRLGESRSLARTFNSFASARTRDRIEEPSPYLSWQATTGRNSIFLGLTEEQREELGGIEYRSLKTLATVLLGYYIGFHLLGVIVLIPFIIRTPPYTDYINSLNVTPAWWGIFTPASMFNDLGFTLTPDSMISFQNSTLALLFGSFLIVIGNTGFPCMLRFIIWVCSKVVRFQSGLWEELEFLLDHPRRCFTLLFPSKATWWLFWVLVLLNGVDLLFFVVLDLNGTPVSDLSPGFKVLNGWFQAVSTRTAGFACVNLAALHPAVQVSYMIMMYISVFPIAISVRRTNVYEEKSLGIFGGEEEVNNEEGAEPSYVSHHLRRQLSFDLWYIILGLFIIAWVEGDRIEDNNQPGFTMFNVLFEIVSAYGTVGLSLGYPGINASFSAEFRVISKLVICAMMIRGRHRGLPYALDRAILLPSEKLQEKEAADAARRYAVGRQNSVGFSASEFPLDEYGLPVQHNLRHVQTAPNGANGIEPVTSHASGVGISNGMGNGIDATRSSLASRRASVMSSTSRHSLSQQQSPSSAYGATRTRRKSLARFIASGLSAGPSLSKHD
jgi:potassium uptake Trk family protein